MNNSNEHATYWSLNLLDLLQQMAEKNSNAVLEVLQGIDRLESERRYPDAGLLFADNQWRAFYHCHKDNLVHPDEHGHFHLFTDIGDQQWAHVAGLSIDANGQPLQWFMVNRWVTDGPWLGHELFLDKLNAVTADASNETLLGQWLASMLQLYNGSLPALLKDRDKALALKSKDKSLHDKGLKDKEQNEAMEDRDIYTLATLEINLQKMLEQNLLNKPVITQQQNQSNKKVAPRSVE